MGLFAARGDPLASPYSNSKEKVMINQSKYHIIIEPNNNGFDKYLIQKQIKNPIYYIL